MRVDDSPARCGRGLCRRRGGTLADDSGPREPDGHGEHDQRDRRDGNATDGVPPVQFGRRQRLRRARDVACRVRAGQRQPAAAVGDEPDRDARTASRPIRSPQRDDSATVRQRLAPPAGLRRPAEPVDCPHRRVAVGHQRHRRGGRPGRCQRQPTRHATGEREHPFGARSRRRRSRTRRRPAGTGRTAREPNDWPAESTRTARESDDWPAEPSR